MSSKKIPNLKLLLMQPLPSVFVWMCVVKLLYLKGVIDKYLNILTSIEYQALLEKLCVSDLKLQTLWKHGSIFVTITETHKYKNMEIEIIIQFWFSRFDELILKNKNFNSPLKYLNRRACVGLLVDQQVAGWCSNRQATATELRPAQTSSVLNPHC